MSSPLYALSPAPFLQFFDASGNLLSGGLVFTYLNNTATPAVTYIDATGNTPNKNPIILDAYGSANIWLPPGQLFTFVLSPPTDTTPPTNPIRTINNVGASGAVATMNFSVDTGTANNYATLVPGVTALFAGLVITLQIANTNTAAATLNVNSLGASPIVLQNGAFLGGGELQSGGHYLLQYTGTVWQILQAVPYPAIAAEITLGVSIVNVNEPPACVERYATNSPPATNDMSGAWLTAVKVAMTAGLEVTYGSSGQHLLTSAVNCTFANAAIPQPGLIIRNVGLSGAGVGASTTGSPVYSILARHTQSCIFDFTGNGIVLLEGLTVTTDPVTYPETAFLTARNQYKSSLYFTAIRCRVVGSFSIGPYYNFGSEEDCLINCIWWNNASTPNTKTRVYTSTNIFGISSAFLADPFGFAVSVASGNVSCIDHNVYSNVDANVCGNSVETADCVYLDACDSYKSFGGWADSTGPQACPTNSNPGTGGGNVQAYAVSGVMTVSLASGTFTGAIGLGMQVNGTGIPLGTVVTSFGTGSGGVGTYNILSGPGASTTWGSSGSPISVGFGHAGRSLVFVDMTNGPSNYGVIHGLTGEDSTPRQKYGVLFNNPNAVANQAVGWDIQGCKLTASGYGIGCTGANAAMAILGSCNIRNIVQGSTGYGCSWPGTVLASRIDSTIAWTINIATNSMLIGDQVNQISVNTVNGGARVHTGVQPTFATGIISGSNNWTFTGGAPTISAIYTYLGNEIDFLVFINPVTQVSTTSNATFAAPAAALVGGGSPGTYPCEVIDATQGTLLSYAMWNLGTVTIRSSIAATGDVIMIRGRAPVS